MRLLNATNDVRCNAAFTTKPVIRGMQTLRHGKAAAFPDTGNRADVG